MKNARYSRRVKIFEFIFILFLGIGSILPRVPASFPIGTHNLEKKQFNLHLLPYLQHRLAST